MLALVREQTDALLVKKALKMPKIPRSLVNRYTIMLVYVDDLAYAEIKDFFIQKFSAECS